MNNKWIVLILQFNEDSLECVWKLYHFYYLNTHYFQNDYIDEFKTW